MQIISSYSGELNRSKVKIQSEDLQSGINKAADRERTADSANKREQMKHEVKAEYHSRIHRI